MAARSGARTKLVHRSTLEQTEDYLKQLPKKEKDHVSLQEAIGNVAESIREAIAKGHSYDELAGLLSEQFGVSVSAWSLKRYLSLGSKQSGATKAAPKNGRRRRLQGEVADETNLAERNGQGAIAQVASTPILTLVPDPAPTAAAPATKTRKARTPRAPQAETAAPKRQTSAAKTKSTGRRAKADATPAPKPGRRKKGSSTDS